MLESVLMPQSEVESSHAACTFTVAIATAAEAALFASGIGNVSIVALLSRRDR